VGIVTLAGTVALGSLELSAMMVPPAGAGALITAKPVTEFPPTA